MADPAWLDRTRYPFAAQYLDLPAGRMHYVDEGDGPAVVMVHGNPTWSFLYRHLIRHLRPRYCCVVPDLLGFGLSDKPPDWSYQPQEHAANLAALIEHLGLSDLTLVVHDWGGPIGLSYAIEHPERVRRLVILNTWMWPLRSEPYYRAFSGLVGGPVGRFLTRRFNFFARVVMKKVYGDEARLTEAIHQHYLRPLGTPAERIGSAVFPKQMVACSAWLESLWARRSRLDPMPKMFVWGMKDVGFRSKELAQWTQSFPDARIVRLADVGHYVQEEAPDRLNEAIDAFFASTHP